MTQAITHQGVALSRPLEQVLCILLVASAIKAPLEIPLYLNAILLLVGVFALFVLQSLDRLFLWIVALLLLGTLAATDLGVLSTSGPRLAQVFLIVFATCLMTRLDPELFARYLLLLLPLMLLGLVAESLLPEPLHGARKFFGVEVARQVGLHGDPNYNAMMYGVVGVILAQHRPRCLGILPFLFAVPSTSRGVVIGALAWLGAQLAPRLARWLLPALVLLLCAQPLIVLAVDSSISEPTRHFLNRVSSERYPIWLAYVNMGLSHPLGVGYFRGEVVMKLYDSFFAPHYPPRQAHSIFLQVFGEFGWAGYILFVGFLLRISVIVQRWAPREVPTLLFVLAGYAFVNGLSDWPFWVALGYVLARARVGAERAAEGQDAHARP